MDIKTIYWLAGLLEGEGCFLYRFQPSPNTGILFLTVKIQLNMTDKDTVSKVAKIWGKNVGSYNSNMGYKPSYKIALAGPEAIAWMFTLYPLMGRRRKDKIKEIVGEWKQYTANPRKLLKTCKRGHIREGNTRRGACITCEQYLKELKVKVSN